MKISKELRDYENAQASKIEIERVNFEPNGVFSVKVWDWDGNVFEGYVADNFVHDLLGEYKPYKGYKKFKVVRG